MVRNDGAEVRKNRISLINRTIHKWLNAVVENGSNSISLKKTVSLLILETGLTEDRIMEYLKILEDVGNINLDIEKDRINQLAEE